MAVALATAKYQRNAEAAFVDDTWKLTPKVTLTLGLRYELTPPWTNTLNNQFTVAVPHIYAFANAPGHALHASPGELQRSVCRPSSAEHPLDHGQREMQ